MPDVANIDFWESDHYDFAGPLTPSVNPDFFDSEQYDLPFNQVTRNLSNIDMIGGPEVAGAATLLLVSPAEGTITPTVSIVIDVISNDPGFLVILADDELVYKFGAGFGTAYQGAANTVAVIAGGWRITASRDAGWPLGPQGFGGNATAFNFVVSAAVDITPPTVALSRTVDERTLDVIFSEPVVTSDAVTPSNYIITPSLAVKSVKRITDLHFQLTTGPQTLLGGYQVQVINVRDLANNPI